MFIWIFIWMGYGFVSISSCHSKILICPQAKSKPNYKPIMSKNRNTYDISTYSWGEMEHVKMTAQTNLDWHQSRGQKIVGLFYICTDRYITSWKVYKSIQDRRPRGTTQISQKVTILLNWQWVAKQDTLAVPETVLTKCM